MRRIALWPALLLLAAAPADAAVVSFEFTGEVFGVTPNFESIVSVGSPLAGVLSYDTATPDALPADPAQGNYPDATLEFTMGSYAYAGTGLIRIFDEAGFDQFQFLGETDGADPIGGLALNQVGLDFVADTTLFASDALPAAPPALGDPALVQSVAVLLGVIPPGLGIHYQYAYLQTLPEPGGPAAAIAAASALAALARRRC
jgi:hypothetical protein